MAFVAKQILQRKYFFVVHSFISRNSQHTPKETNPVSHFSHTKGKHLIHEEGRHWLLCQSLLRACGMDPAYSRRGSQEKQKERGRRDETGERGGKKKSSLMRGATLLGTPPFNNTHNTMFVTDVVSPSQAPGKKKRFLALQREHTGSV